MKIDGWGIVTEYVANGSLKSFLEKNGQDLTMKQLLNFGIVRISHLYTHIHIHTYTYKHYQKVQRHKPTVFRQHS